MNSPTHPVSIVVRTVRLKVKPETAAWLNDAASEVNAVWNWANEVSARAARPFVGKPKWLSGFQLNNLSAGATEYFEKIGADMIQRVSGEYAVKGRTARRSALRWRVSRGARRSLDWVPFKAASLKRKGRSVRFCGKQMLRYKGEHAGRSVVIVSEKYTSRACSSCGSLTGPRGVNGLCVRRWRCANCGESHDRDVNVARNVLRRAEVSASVRGNESSSLPVPPSRAPRSREAGPTAARVAA